MIRAIGRIAYGTLWLGANAVTLESAEDAYRFRHGMPFWTGPSTDPDSVRIGEHRVSSVDVDTGVVFTLVPVTANSPCAASLDYIFADENTQPWSPYPIGSADPAPADAEA